MDKFDYFVAALKKGCAGRPHWMASVFSSMEHEVYDPGKHKLPPKDALNLIRENSKVYPYRIFRVAQDSKERCFINYGNEDDNPLIESIGEIEKMKPMLSFTDKIIIDEAIIPTAKAKIETCYGNLLVNWLLLFIPFGTKIDFLTGKLDGGMLDKIVNSKYSIEKKPAGERDNSFIYVDEYLIYQKNAAYLDNWASFSTASVSLKGLTPNPEVAKFFKEKLKEKGDKLTVTDLAIIEEEAAKLDKATFKGTEDGNFLTSKNINVGRKKMFYIYGLEEGFGLSTIVQAPLSEGVKAEDLPDYSNALRAASHNRGAQTALGGVGVKRANQIFQSIRIDSEDCGDKEGYSYIATDVRDLDGTYVFMKDGIRLITPDEAEQLLGREIKIRSPMRCKQGTPHYCAMCVGKDVAMLPHGVHNTIAAINSREMLIFMKAMHGRSLSTSEYDLKRSFY